VIEMTSDDMPQFPAWSLVLIISYLGRCAFLLHHVLLKFSRISILLWVHFIFCVWSGSSVSIVTRLRAG
jgi:hypothetical protein